MNDPSTSNGPLSLRSVAPILVPGLVVIVGAFAVIRFGVNPKLTLILDNVHWTFSYTLAAVLAWWGVKAAPPDARVARRWFALGMSAYAFGQMVWDVQVAVGWNPFPGPSDIFFSCLGPGCLLGLWASLRVHSSKEQLRTALLDASTLAVAVLVLTLSLYLPKQGSTGPLALAVLVAYPVTLLGALCVGVILILTLRARADRTWLVFIMALLAQGMVWMHWNSLTLDNALQDGTWFNFCFSMAAVGSGLGAMWWRPQLSIEPTWDRLCEWLLRVLPVLSVVIAAASLFVLQQLPPIARAMEFSLELGVAAVVALAMARQSLVLAERDRLLFAEQRLRENESRFRVLFDSNLTGVFFTDTRGAVSQANDAFLRLTGYSREDMVAGRISWKTMTPPEHVPRDEQGVRELAATGVSTPWEKEYIRKDGTRVAVIVGAAHIEAGRDELIAFALDLTPLKRAEAALGASENKFQLLVEQAADGIFIADRDGRFLEANLSGCAMLGYGREEILRLSIPDVHPPAEAVRVAASMPGLMAGETVRVEYLFRRKDGSVFPGHLSAKMLSDGRLQGIVRDVSERKRTEKSLEESEARFRQIIEHAPDAIVILDLSTGKFILVNAAAEQLFRLSAAELLRLGPAELSPPMQPDGQPSGEKAQLFLTRVVQEGKLDFEWVHRDAQGRDIACEVRLLRLLLDGRTVIRGSLTDISDRKQLEQARERSHSLVQATLESTADGILVVNREGRIETYNRLFARMWCIPDEVLIAQDDARAMQCVLEQLRDPQQFTTKVTYLYDHPEEKSFDRIDFKDGRVFERYSRPQLIGGEVVGRVWSFRDTTEQRRLEEQLRQSQKMEAIGQLSGGIAHDFNNLLTAIMGHLGLLQGNPQVTPQIAESLGEISAAANRAANLTSQLLAFSRRQVISISLLDLNEVVTNLSKMLRRVLGEQVTVQLDFAPEKLTFQGDAGMMEQVLVNLAVNARDAMPQGGKLRITTRRETRMPPAGEGVTAKAPGDFVRLSVGDTGTGILQEFRAKIFEPFFTTKGVGKGTGLGLATVFGIVQQHHGWIEVESEVGRGTTFHIFLPLLAPPPTTRLVGGEAGQAARVARGRGELILLVEDEAAVQQIVMQALGRYGYRVLLAGNGPEALKIWAARKTEIALLLTDLIMPEGISGLQLARLLLEENPLLRVVYTSGYSADIAGKELKMTDGVNYLAKPYELDRLFQTVRTALDRKVSHSPF